MTMPPTNSLPPHSETKGRRAKQHWHLIRKLTTFIINSFTFCKLVNVKTLWGIGFTKKLPDVILSDQYNFLASTIFFKQKSGWKIVKEKYCYVGIVSGELQYNLSPHNICIYYGGATICFKRDCPCNKWFCHFNRHKSF